MAVMCFCGDDTRSLENAVIALKQNYEQVVSVEAPYTISKVEETVSNTALFPTTKLVIFRDITSGGAVFRGKPSKSFAPILTVLQQKTAETDVLFIDTDPKKTKTYEALFSHALIKSFALPNYLYGFLDVVYPGNGTKAIELLNKANDTSAAELAFFLLKRRVRDLILMLQKRPIPGMLEWQSAKLRSQATRWSIEKLYGFYAAMWSIERGIKTSTLPYEVKNALEIALSYYAA